MKVNSQLVTPGRLHSYWALAAWVLSGVAMTPAILAAAPAAEHAKSQAVAVATISKPVLGSIIFHDAALSNPPGQACATCHQPDKAFADPGMASSQGAIEGTFGSRNTPSLTYVNFVPPFQPVDYEPGWVGGLFWDGRVNTLKEQALKPLTNPIEMNNSIAGLAKKLRSASYYGELLALYDKPLATDDQLIAEAAADALATFQASEQLHPFNSKYDYYDHSLVELTEQELHGFEIYNDKGKCTECHAEIFNAYELFTGYRHHNILVPANTQLRFYKNPKAANPQGHQFIDIGLAANPKLTGKNKTTTRGLFRTPTLRNVELTPPYMHNGRFKTLEDVVDFYNDISSMGAPELQENPTGLLTSPLNLTKKEKAALVAFLKTLTDGYKVPNETLKALRKKQALRIKAL